MSVVSPARSFCPKCNRAISWKDNIPLLGWLLLRGKCRHCEKPISSRYPLVEVISAFLAVASYIVFGATPTAIVIYALGASLVVISFIDFDFKIIPNVISLPGIVIGLAIGVISQFSGIFDAPVSTGALDSLIGMLAGGGFFYIVGEVYYLITKRNGLGGGDIKLLGMTGAILGWKSVAPTIFVGSLLGAILGIGLMIFRGGGRQLEIPFGPWLSAGVLVYIFGDLPFFRV